MFRKATLSYPLYELIKVLKTVRSHKLLGSGGGGGGVSQEIGNRCSGPCGYPGYLRRSFILLDKVTVHEPDLHTETHLSPVQVLSTTIESFSPRMVPW